MNLRKTDEQSRDCLGSKAPAGFIQAGLDLMPYWTPDGRTIDEIWRTEHAKPTLSHNAAATADVTEARRVVLPGRPPVRYDQGAIDRRG